MNNTLILRGGESLARDTRTVFELLEKLRGGLLEVRLPDGSSALFGDGEAGVTLHVHDEAMFGQVLARGSDVLMLAPDVQVAPGALVQAPNGAVLLAAGEPGKRIALPNSRIMIHQPLGGAQGQASDIEIHAREILTIRDRLNKVLADHTGQPIDVIARDTDRDNFLSAQEAAEYGLIDKVLANRNAV